MTEEFVFSFERLFDFTKNVFTRCGMNDADASQAASVLLSADLRGIDSHGVARLSGYIRLYEAKRANFAAKAEIIHQTPATATIDAQEGLGLVIAPQAMEIAIEKAKQCGTGMVAIQNSNHFGIAAYHAMLALEHDMIGIAMTNASPLVAPTHSKERMLGTNPMCYAFPTENELPVVVDLATSTAANGKLEIAQRTGKPIPKGWVIDKNGEDTTNPNALKEGGVLLPLGSGDTQAGHKGFGLSAVPANEFKQHMDHWVKRFKQAQPIDKNIPIIIPGEPEFEHAAYRKVHGIPLNPAVVDDLQKLGAQLGVTL